MLEKIQKNFLVPVSLLIALVYAVCFYRNHTGIACAIFGVFITALFFFVIIRKKKRKLTGWDICYGCLIILLEMIPACTANESMIRIGKCLFFLVLVKWAVHIAYGIHKISFMNNLLMYISFVMEVLTQFFTPLTDIGMENRYRRYRNYGYAPPYPNRMNGAAPMRNGVPPMGGLRTQNGVPPMRNVVPPMGDSRMKTGVPTMPNEASPMQTGMPPVQQPSAEGKKHYSGSVFTGIVLALPFLVIVLILLTSADVVFKRLVSNLLLGIDDLGDAIVWCFVFAFGYLAAYTCGRTLILKKVSVTQVYHEKANNVTGITFAGIFSAVYVLFCSVQLLGFLSKGGFLLPEGYTYARYARTGFFQLLVVCVINVGMVILCRIKFETERVLKILLTVISVCTYFMTASSAYRIILYIRYYQLTFLRVFTLWMLAVITVWMVFVTWFIYNDQIKLFEYGLVTLAALFIILALMRPDRVVMTYNLDGFNLEKSDTGYLFYELSEDGAVELLHSELADMEAYRPELLDYCSRIVEKYERNGREDFRKFNWSRYAAYQAAKEYLTKYGDSVFRA